MPTQPLGWFKKEINGPDDFKGLKYRTVGLASNVMQAMGASVAQLPGPEILPAMEKGVIDAFEFNNPTSDSRFGAQDVAKFYYLGSYHQASEAIEVVYNKTKFDGLAKEQQQILKLAAQATSADDGWKAWDIYSKDLETLDHQAQRAGQAHAGVDLQGAARCLGQGRQEISANSAQGPFIKKILDSQKDWGKRVGFYAINNEGDFKTAYEHYFGQMKV